MNKSHRLFSFITALALLPTPSPASPQCYRAPGVATVELRHEGAADRTKGRVPSCVVCHLGRPEVLTLDFDILDGQSEALYYSFTHCDAQWEPSDLMEMEYVDGLNKIYGQDTNRPSLNTTIPFMHYTLAIDTSPLRKSGNYLVEVRNAADDHLVVREPIWVSEDLCGVGSRVEKLGASQEVSLCVRWTSHGLSSPETQLTVCAWQNKRLDDMRHATGPTFVRPDEIVYHKLPEMRFCGGTEWRWLDTRSIRLPGLSDAGVEFVSGAYHFTAVADAPAKDYSYREDFDGGQWIETRDRRDNDAQVAADYAFAHLTFQPDDPAILSTHDVHVIGDATGWEPAAANRMTPDHDDMSLNGQALVKQGLHNYLYVARPKRGRRQSPQMTETEGCFGETENDYHIAVYVRRPGDTYDRLVAVKTHNTMKTVNEFIN